MDSSVRFAATRDALLRANASIIYSIEPFSIAPDTRQGPKLSNLYRTFKDITGDWTSVLNRASAADKWAPLSSPGNWADPDMINVGTHLTDGENRVYFGLWAIMKAPLLLSANLPMLPLSIQTIIASAEVVAVNQDALGIAGRKLLINGEPLPWLVGLERCDAGVGGGLTGGLTRGGWGGLVGETRQWTTLPSAVVPGGTLIYNSATGRCLVPGATSGYALTVVLLPCDSSNVSQAWSFPAGSHTVGAIVHNESGLALAIANSTLHGATHGPDAVMPDIAYGITNLTLVSYFEPIVCTYRNCEGYEPSQLWYWDGVDNFIAAATYTASINHCFEGDCYELTAKPTTFAHHCLAHTLSTANEPTDSALTEVWGGPLTGGAFVLGLLNSGNTSNTIAAPFDHLGFPGIGPTTRVCVRDLWAQKSLGAAIGIFSLTVPAHDIAIISIIPTPGNGAC